MISRLVAIALLLGLPTNGFAKQNYPIPKYFDAGALQTAEVTGLRGKRSVVLMVYGDPKLGQAMQTPCELHAKERSDKRWQLVPFASDLMDISDRDIAETNFTLKWIYRTKFRVGTDFKGCAVGLTFDGVYRAR